MPREHLHFVTGRLAEFALRQRLAELAPAVGFDYSIGVLGITVAALMTTEWVAKRLEPPAAATRVILPGYCRGELAIVAEKLRLPVERGPKDLRDLDEFFGQPKRGRAEYGAYDIEILAEINHAPRLRREEIVAAAERLRASGADVIDLGCDPGDTWGGVAEAVRALRDAGHRVSIDSMNTVEIAAAAKAGAELVLSVNHTNRDAASDWGCEVVVLPDVPGTLEGLEETVEQLATAGVRLRVDPILEPIGFGFAASLERYMQVRARMPEAEMMMGIGNLTELTDVDSAGVNVLLLGVCEELGIRSVLTTEVINWARSSVRECDLARRLVYYAVRQRALPKHVEPRLVMLRDTKPHTFGEEALSRLADEIRDHNFRLFVEGGQLHLISAGLHLRGEDPYLLFQEMTSRGNRTLDASHAFYLGYEMAKAVTALTLGKDYRQDEALEWGFLTRAEQSHRARARNKTDEPSSHSSEDSASEDV
ncbi:MAG: dihydropteroate synthase [Pirellulales bacterium]|nr:dihydropteroate synthase [Pirellulales bacterium]